MHSANAQYIYPTYDAENYWFKTPDTPSGSNELTHWGSDAYMHP